ncbi:tumor necrosis factor receptor superfamily member 9-like [Physella acuta]|uniref:tumor necrosis factor receptor superfamily member 9-like n=1 Tax=Physella acuta TaxID=109671 RepID=UPI0027DC4608|nr:tumor necrosis factor receptor superfamily member 9-like [Physella acuta]
MNELSGLLRVMLVVSTLGSARGTGCDPDIPSRPPPQQTPGPISSCDAGQFKDVKTQSCLPCPPDTFVTKLMVERGFGTCEKCLEPVQYEIKNANCTSTRDSEIMCEYGFFRSISGSTCDGKCESCDICGTGDQLSLNYDKQHCGGFSNTICCKHDYMVIVNGECVDLSTIQHPTSAATTTHSVTTPPTATTTDDSQSKHSKNIGTKTTLSMFLVAAVLCYL